MIHEDERRMLEDWPEAKIITAKQDCILGNHYHKIKTERFILSRGIGFIIVDDKLTTMKIGKMYSVNPGQLHSFSLRKNAILIGLCSHIFDPSDDYKL